MKLENNNKEIIKKITKRTIKSNKVRNIFVILAIILTTFMISSVFSIGVSFVKNYKIMNLRLQGTTASVSLNNPNKEQLEEINKLDLFTSVGKEINAGVVEDKVLSENRTRICLKYSDKDNYEKQMKPCISDIKGVYPNAENEIMVSKKALELLNKKNAKIGDEINLNIKINKKIVNKEFTISGYYKDYGIIQDTGYFLVSKKFIDNNKLTLENNGHIIMTIKNDLKDTAPITLDEKVKLNSGQKFSYTYDRMEDTSETTIVTIVTLLVISLFIILSGYLLIYNIIYISVTKDINFYGMLKTIGASPKQIKKIIRGQAYRLSIIGIPIGLLLGVIVSFVLVPLVMKELLGGVDANTMPGDVYFNPIVFVSSILFSLFTVIISCRKPAKIAGNISPTEALKYVGGKIKKKNRTSTNGGKIYKMAWYNVFREKKRAIIVFLSLFMGIITFLSINTFSHSLSVDNFIKRYVKNDFQIQNLDVEKGKIDESFINEINEMEGVTSINRIKVSYLELEMNDNVILPSIKRAYESFGYSKKELNHFLKLIEKDPSQLSAPIVGIDDKYVEKINDSSKIKFDVEAFKEGKLAIGDSWDYGENYKDISGKITIKNPKTRNEFTSDIVVLEDKEGYFVPGMPSGVGIPSIYISQSVLEKLDNELVDYLININVDEKYEKEIRKKLEELCNNRGLLLDSKSQETADFKKSQLVMNILGGGISIILILIGILNFINVIITGVNIRLKELAVIESIGMTKKQIKKMLTYEGLYYALITTIFISTIGMAIIYAIGKATRSIADYAVFTFPTLPLISLLSLIFIVCLVTPSIVYKTLVKKTVIERIRENNE